MAAYSYRIMSNLSVFIFYLCLLSTSVDPAHPDGKSPVGNITYRRSLNIDNLNPNIARLKIASPTIKRAHELENLLQKGELKPFKRVIYANVGDAHSQGQKPITYIRQVLACVTSPDLIKSGGYPDDVKQRANEILDSLEVAITLLVMPDKHSKIPDITAVSKIMKIVGHISGRSVGTYTTVEGVELIRRHVAEYIERRDGHPSNWQDICFFNGASNAIKHVLELFVGGIRGKPSGLMLPIPEFDLYRRMTTLYNFKYIEYYLNEERNWGLDVNELERAYQDAVNTTAVRALVVINPGNPSGQVQSYATIEAVIKFAHRRRLVLLADEVYQHNVYAEGSKFYSFKQVLKDMGEPYSSEVELVSFMSTSKGYMSECGLRGGWAELVNLNPSVQAALYTALTIDLSPNTLGQVAIDLVAKPPQLGEPSYKLWEEEKTEILESLRQRAAFVTKAFNNIEGYQCNAVQGAMYAFPRFSLSKKAVEAAAAAGMAPEVFYTYQLLEETGICVLPGTSGPGRYHFRTTILPQSQVLNEMMESIKLFHQNFTKQYRD